MRDMRRSGEVALLHVAPPVMLLMGLWIVPRQQGVNLVEHPAQTLRIAGVCQGIFSVAMYSWVALKQKRCQGTWELVWRSFFSLPIGALALIVLAVIFGAPLDFAHLRKTLYWGQLISSLVVLPAGIVFGVSWSDWHRLFAFTRPRGALEYSICIPAHGAVVGAWFGAWPMPLDWERPWQEWPVCVTYGMAAGFIVGEIASIILVFLNAKRNED